MVSVESRYYISSLDADASKLLDATRTHWGIENSVHWVLDIAFREDECRIRKANGAHNFAILRRIALNLLKQENSVKLGIHNKRLNAAWDTDYLMKVLSTLFRNYSGCISVVKGMNGWPRSAFSMARTTLRPCLRTVEM